MVQKSKGERGRRRRTGRGEDCFSCFKNSPGALVMRRENRQSLLSLSFSSFFLFDYSVISELFSKLKKPFACGYPSGGGALTCSKVSRAVMLQRSMWRESYKKLRRKHDFFSWRRKGKRRTSITIIIKALFSTRKRDLEHVSLSLLVFMSIIAVLYVPRTEKRTQ